MLRVRSVPPDPTMIKIRWGTPADRKSAVEIMAASYDEPMGEREFERVANQKSVVWMVAVRGEHQDPFTFRHVRGEVLGFMMYSIKLDSIDLMDMAVAPAHRRDGVGTAMIAKLKGKVADPETRFRAITASVSEYMTAAQLFLRSQDFRAIGVRRGMPDFDIPDSYEFRYEPPSRPVAESASEAVEATL